MGKKLIGNSIFDVVIKVLNGETSHADIDKIYENSYFTRDEIPGIIGKWSFNLMSAVAAPRAEAEIEVKTKANDILEKLWDQNKIVLTRYKVPKGETVVVQPTPTDIEYGRSEEYQTSGDSRGEVVNINGQFYALTNNADDLCFNAKSVLFDGELELIADQLCSTTQMFAGTFSGNNCHQVQTRIFFMKKLFPQYQMAIDQVSNKQTNMYDIKSCLELLKKASEQQGEQTKTMPNFLADKVADSLKTLGREPIPSVSHKELTP